MSGNRLGAARDGLGLLEPRVGVLLEDRLSAGVDLGAEPLDEDPEDLAIPALSIAGKLARIEEAANRHRAHAERVGGQSDGEEVGLLPSRTADAKTAPTYRVSLGGLAAQDSLN
jgi:hypothetical protein